MSEGAVVLRAAVKEATEEARRGLQLHPLPEEMVAYDSRELADEVCARIRDHLAICPQCAQTVLDLSTFPEVPLRAMEMRLSPEEDEEDLRHLLGQLPDEQAEVLTFAGPVPGPRRRWVVAVAASFIAGALGLGLWLAEVPSPLRHPAEDVREGVLLDLYPVDRGSRGSRADEAVEIPAGESHLVLLLNASDLGEFVAYEVEISSALGMVLSRDGLKPGDKGTFTLVVPRSFLPAGSYELSLYGTAQERERTQLARYRIQIGYDDPR